MQEALEKYLVFSFISWTRKKGEGKIWWDVFQLWKKKSEKVFTFDQPV